VDFVSRSRRACGERGASLILAIAFMVVVGGVSLATLSYVTSGIGDRKVLDNVRDREYAADGAIQFAISEVRKLGGPGPGMAACNGPYVRELNAVEIRVDCVNAPAMTSDGFLQRNVIFTACPNSSSQCNDANAIIRSQVNYQARGANGVLAVTRTWTQSWSVNR
jgi:hypothetical protein